METLRNTLYSRHTGWNATFVYLVTAWLTNRKRYICKRKTASLWRAGPSSGGRFGTIYEATTNTRGGSVKKPPLDDQDVSHYFRSSNSLFSPFTSQYPARSPFSLGQKYQVPLCSQSMKDSSREYNIMSLRISYLFERNSQLPILNQLGLVCESALIWSTVLPHL